MTIDRGMGSGSAAAPVFVARGLSKNYGSGEAAVHALRGLDLDIFAGADACSASSFAEN